jgi:4-hydroxymandelate synthase
MVAQTFEDLQVDYIELYVSDIARATEWLVEGYGFAVYAISGPAGETAASRSVGLGTNQIRLVLTQPLARHHRGTAYLAKHGDGVADIALRVPSAAAAFGEAVRRGARPVAPPAGSAGIVTATVLGFGDVAHTFVQRPAGADERALPSLRPVTATPPGPDAGLAEVDHFAVCVEAGLIDSTVEFYQQVLDFKLIFTERIVVGAQAIVTKVVQSRSGAVTLTLIEPDVSRAPGHIDDFLAHHGGAGVQHIAFTADDIVHAVGSIKSRGVEFLATPATYYGLLAERLHVSRHSLGDLQQHNVLVDEDHYGQLFQIFSKSVHPRETLFFEIIERFGARTFGSGNIKALYEAVELQRSKDAAA